MRISKTLILMGILSILAPTRSDAEFRIVDGGSIRIEENISNPKYPSHYVNLNRTEGQGGIESLTLRCDNNRTEAFINIDGVYGHDGTLSLRWKGQERARRVGATSSTTGTAAFLSNAIGFITRLYTEGEVIAAVEGYSTRGTARYELSPELREGIRDLASTCEWVGRLPAEEASASEEVEDDPDVVAVRELLPQIDRIGREKFIRILRELD